MFFVLMKKYEKHYRNIENYIFNIYFYIIDFNNIENYGH